MGFWVVQFDLACEYLMHLTSYTIVKSHMYLQVYCICLSSAPPPAPNVTNISFAVGTSFSVEWSEPVEIVDGTDFYIAPNDLNCTRDTVTMSTCQYSIANQGQTYNITVSTHNSTLNCGTQRSEATATVNLQGMHKYILISD